jgi:NAD(P)-dependent dehydrogenase (short-subunit alcohol dehydrogenase family)
MNTPGSLQNKAVAITGGFGALGRAVAQEALAAGARVVLIDKDAPPAGLPDGALALGGIDLADAESARRAIDDAATRCAGLDALVNVAGAFRHETVELGSIDTWDRLYAVNVRTTFLASQAALPHLAVRGAGRVVNVGALAAEQAGYGMGAYAASKSGVARLTEALSEEFKDRGVTVNAVLPSILDTAANRADMPQADFARWVEPRALARVIVFLLSPDAAPINGALIPVKGRT